MVIVCKYKLSFFSEKIICFNWKGRTNLERERKWRERSSIRRSTLQMVTGAGAETI